MDTGTRVTLAPADDDLPEPALANVEPGTEGTVAIVGDNSVAVRWDKVRDGVPDGWGRTWWARPESLRPIT